MESYIHTSKPLIAPSLLSADFSCLGRDVKAADEAGADMLHFDIMDGHFVPNITFGPMVVRSVRNLTKLPFDVHLMIEHPERFIEDFALAGADAITVHAETCPHLHSTVQQIRAAGVRAGVSLNPSTPAAALEYVIGDIDFILIMTVNPGFGGQSFIESMLPKIRIARDMSGPQIDIGVDGGIDEKTAPRVFNAGANVLIAGTSVFGYSEGVKAAVENLRSAAGSAGLCGR